MGYFPFVPHPVYYAPPIKEQVSFYGKLQCETIARAFSVLQIICIHYKQESTNRKDPIKVCNSSV